MKKLIFIFILLPFIGKTQVYQAGTVFPYYYDIVPDTLINMIGNNSPQENYYFDANSDLIDDFRIQSFGSGGLGGGSHYINFTPLNLESTVRFGRKDSVWHNWSSYWMVTPVAKPLQFGDSINSAVSNWVNTVVYLYNNSGSAGSYTNVKDWESPNDLFLGLKYQSVSDTIYGWIRVNCPYASQCYVKDFSFTKNYAGITENALGNITTFPNPASQAIHITGSESKFQKSQIEIINYLGQTVLRMDYANIIDVSKLPQGIYTIKITTKLNQCFYSKFVKE